MTTLELQMAPRLGRPPRPVVASDFPALLTAYRQRADLSINQLARRVRIDPSYVSRLERAERNPPKPVLLEGFVRALGLGTADRQRLLLSAAGISDSRWVDDVLHDATRRAAHALLAACPCEPCGAQRATTEAVG